MRKLLILASLMLLLNACGAIAELSAFNQCEFRLYSLTEPRLCGIDVSQKRSWKDFSVAEGAVIAAYMLGSTLPFEVTAYVEIRNPGTQTAAVEAIKYKVKVDDVKVATGRITERVAVPPSGGRVLIPVPLHADLIHLLKSDNARSLMNLSLNLVNSGRQESRISLKIKPSVRVGSRSIPYPGYFTLTKEFSSGPN
jgi:LEA14-like dessication related protein